MLKLNNEVLRCEFCGRVIRRVPKKGAKKKYCKKHAKMWKAASKRIRAIKSKHKNEIQNSTEG